MTSTETFDNAQWADMPESVSPFVAGQAYSVVVEEDDQAIQEAKSWVESGEERCVQATSDFDGKTHYATAVPINFEKTEHYELMSFNPGTQRVLTYRVVDVPHEDNPTPGPRANQESE